MIRISRDVYASTDEDRLINALRNIRHMMLDLDGTIYLGDHLLEHTLPFLEKTGKLGITHTFLTNNPTKSAGEYLAKLRELGLKVTPDEIYTSSHGTIDHLKLNHPEVKRLFIVGTPTMKQELLSAGFTEAGENPDDRPDALVVAFDTTLNYDKLCRAAWWASRGIYYIATNPDRVCPTNTQTILVDCGSICQAIAHACGRMPDYVIGKPNPGMLHCIMEKKGFAPGKVAMCGDRIYTDVAAGLSAGCMAVLVLSGETTLDEALKNPMKPTLVVPHVGTLATLFERAHTISR